MTVLPLAVTPQPSWVNASSMTRVSSESSKSWITVLPWLRADSSSTRFEMLLEPGRVTVPSALTSGGISRNSVENIQVSAGPWGRQAGFIDRRRRGFAASVEVVMACAASLS